MHKTLLLALVLAMAVSAPRAQAQDSFPASRVTLVVPSPAGSTTDALARLVAEQLSQRWGKPVIVENNSRGLNAGAEQVGARSARWLHAAGEPAAAAHRRASSVQGDRLPARAQFVPVSLLAKIANVLSVRKDLPARTVQELVAYGKANPGKLTYASQGGGSTAHLSGAQLEVRAGIKMVHVPYRGAAPALNDLIAGHIDMFFDTLTTSVPLHQADKIRIMAVAGAERAPTLPDIPTIAESGLPGIPLDHLVRHGRPARTCRQRSRRGSIATWWTSCGGPTVERKAARPAARRHDRHARRRRQVLRRGDRALGQGHQEANVTVQ